MDLGLLNSALLVLYFIVLLFIGYLASRKESDEGFLLANRKVGWKSLITTISASYFGGGVLVLITTWAYRYGISVLWVFLGSAIGFLMLMLLAKKIKLLADEHKFYTISDYIGYKFNTKVSIIASIVNLVYFFTWILLQFMAGGLLLSTIIGIPYWVAVLITGGVVLVYLLMAGFKAVVRTDIFQYFIMLVFGFLVVFMLTMDTAFASSQFKLVEGVGGIGGVISFVLMGIFVTLLSGDIWQRIYAAKDVNNARAGLFGAFISVIVIGLIISMLGLIIKAIEPSLPAENALIAGFSIVLPKSLLGIGLLIVFSSIMSTVDTIIFVLAMILSRDLSSHIKALQEYPLVWLTKVCMLLVTCTAIIVSLLTSEIADLGLITTAVIMILGPVILWSFFRKVKKNAAFYSILMGLIIFTGIILFSKMTEGLTILPFLGSLISLVLGQFFCKK